MKILRFCPPPLRRLIINTVIMLRGGHVRIHHTCSVSLDSTFEGANRIYKNTVFSGHMGYGSFIAKECDINARIGRFTSIGPGCRTAIGIHPIRKPYVTTCPMFFSTKKQTGETFASVQCFDEFRWADESHKHQVIIGNDCWIQTNVTITNGVTIGDGTVVMAGAVVTKDAPPYAIVGGVPAKILGYRFSAEEIDLLLKFRWWDKPIDWLRDNWQLLTDFEKLKNSIIHYGLDC